MYGAILGDMIGSPYEFDRGEKTKDFALFTSRSRFTNDSVMTIAVAEALSSLEPGADEEAVRSAVVLSMQKWGNRYPDAGYGGRFFYWLGQSNPQPYNSWGNGSAMRVSSVGWMYETLEETRRYAKLTAEVTHNHPEGIKGAEAVASVIFLARTERSKEDIREYVTREFGYDLSRTCDEIRPEYSFDVSCQGSVPEAITAFLEGEDFEDVIRAAVSLGGDTDTIGAMAGSMAEAFYGVPDELKEECRRRLPEDMLEVLDQFYDRLTYAHPATFHNEFLDGNELIEDTISRLCAKNSRENLENVLDAITQRMHEDGHFLIPVLVDDEDENRFALRTIQTDDGKVWNAVFTSQEEFEKGAPSQIISNFIDSTLRACLDSDATGFVINPWGEAFVMTKELIERIFEAEGDVEYSIPDDQITEALLADGTYLKRAVEICNRNRTKLNLLKLARILSESFVWIPCNFIMSDIDREIMDRAVEEAVEGEGLDSLIGHEFTMQDEVRLVPDILQNGDAFFFPVFTSEDEMGEYGEHFSKVEKHFLEAIYLARNNENNVEGIVINAFSEPFVVPKEIFELIEGMYSEVNE